MTSLRVISTTLIVMAAAACEGNGPSDETAQCLPTGQLANTACADLLGLVTDTEGDPVAGAVVSIPSHAEAGREIEISTGFPETGADGRYRMRATRDIGEAPAEGPDTVTVWVRAVAPADNEQPGPGDSLLVRLEFRPMYTIPVVTEVPTIVITE